ncbi:MAG: chemotaxis protein CheW, partial [Dehalococcoidia bacterium]|nr:chemotaxis protein CheW [Dehalococcoidia bacterium]
MTNSVSEARGELTSQGDSSERQLVVFSLADESFGVNIDSVREIIRWQPVTHVPDTSASVLGVL